MPQPRALSMVLLLGSLATLSGPALMPEASAQSLEELRRQIEEKKREQERKEREQREARERAEREAAERRQREASAAEAARRQREAAAAEAQRQEAERRRLEAERLRLEAQKGTLLIRANRACQLTINGNPEGALEANVSRNVQVRAGDQLIECVASERARAETKATVGAGLQAVALLEVPEDARFMRHPEGIADYQQRLIWSAEDSRRPLTWLDAQKHCEALGPGWQLPATPQLQALFDPESKFTRVWVYAGNAFELKPATDLIRIDSCCLWSNEPDGQMKAYYVGLGAGSRVSALIVKNDVMRALCAKPMP